MFGFCLILAMIAWYCAIFVDSIPCLINTITTQTNRTHRCCLEHTSKNITKFSRKARVQSQNSKHSQPKPMIQNTSWTPIGWECMIFYAHLRLKHVYKPWPVFDFFLSFIFFNSMHCWMFLTIQINSYQCLEQVVVITWSLWRPDLHLPF